MTISIAHFRCEFKEFDNQELYPDSLLNFWADFVAATFSFDCASDAVQTIAKKYALAHYSSLAARRYAESMGGLSVAGQSSGAISQKSVDSASISYDTAAQGFMGAGEWNSTEYGRAYLTIIRPYAIGIIAV